MKKEIIVIVPSRGRPDNAERLVESWKNTTQGKSLILFVLDGDDYQQYNTFVTISGIETVVIPKKRELLTAKLNMFCEDWEEEGAEVISFMGDDCVFLTPGWEDRILEWQRENKGICYCNDLLQGENLPNNVFIHNDIVSALGFMAPPVLQHYFIDNYWKDLGIRLGKLKYFPEIVIEHRHWSNGKSQKDETYIQAENTLMGTDRAAWDKYRETELANDVQKIKDYEKR